MEKFIRQNRGGTAAGLSVVVLDVQRGEVLGMASLEDQNNKALQSFPLGSVFKTIVAAKALEDGVVDLDEEFICNGTIIIDDQMKHCHQGAVSYTHLHCLLWRGIIKGDPISGGNRLYVLCRKG